MADPVLWPLLSDEGGPITKPFYTIDNQLAPTFITQPFSQTVKLGANVTFSPSIVGDVPLTYQWQLNSANITHATNLSLTLTNVQGYNSGLYTVVIHNNYGTATNIPAMLQVNTNAFPLLFSDSLDTDTSANWNFFAGSDDNIPDYTTKWAYNYGVIPYTFNGVTYRIPPAPNSVGGSTLGVRFTVNDANGVDRRGEYLSQRLVLQRQFRAEVRHVAQPSRRRAGLRRRRHHGLPHFRHQSSRHRNQLGRHQFSTIYGRHLVRRGRRRRRTE